MQRFTFIEDESKEDTVTRRSFKSCNGINTNAKILFFTFSAEKDGAVLVLTDQIGKDGVFSWTIVRVLACNLSYDKSFR